MDNTKALKQNFISNLQAMQRIADLSKTYFKHLEEQLEKMEIINGVPKVNDEYSIYLMGLDSTINDMTIFSKKLKIFTNISKNDVKDTTEREKLIIMSVFNCMQEALSAHTSFFEDCVKRGKYKCAVAININADEEMLFLEFYNLDSQVATFQKSIKNMSNTEIANVIMQKIALCITLRQDKNVKAEEICILSDNKDIIENIKLNKLQNFINALN